MNGQKNVIPTRYSWLIAAKFIWHTPENSTDSGEMASSVSSMVFSLPQKLRGVRNIVPKMGHPELDTLELAPNTLVHYVHPNNKLHTYYVHHNRTALRMPGGRPRKKTPFRGAGNPQRLVARASKTNEAEE